MTLIDTHCHLNDVEAFADPGSAIEEARSAGVEQLIVIGVDLASSRLALELAEAHRAVYCTVGHHPNYAHRFVESDLRKYREMLSHPKVVGLGEIGLDDHWDFATADEQRRCLQAQLDLAAEVDKPVVLHCREAYPALLEILEGGPEREWVFHCFSGDRDDARRAMALGGWFGIDGPVTYKKAESLRALIPELPRDRILLETDSPWMTPHPFRSERNRPALLPLINLAVASCLEMSASACADLTTSNARRLFPALGYSK